LFGRCYLSKSELPKYFGWPVKKRREVYTSPL
jgi:hypothetical protein